MTGFGRSHISRDGRELFMELKSVNHRYLDLSFRIPKSLSFLEEALRTLIRSSAIKRGHLEISVTYRNDRTDARTIALDRELVLQCAKETRRLSEKLKKKSPSVAELIRLCDAMTVTQTDEDESVVTSMAQEAFAQACETLLSMRMEEGRHMREDLAGNLAVVQASAQTVAELAPSVPQEYRERLEKRLSEWNVEAADPARVAQEVALMAERCAIDEELARLESHFQQFAACFAQDGEIGRRMDFLLQEMNREINTIGSKASHAGITASVVEMKSVLEKLREQVQNIE